MVTGCSEPTNEERFTAYTVQHNLTVFTGFFEEKTDFILSAELEAMYNSNSNSSQNELINNSSSTVARSCR